MRASLIGVLAGLVLLGGPPRVSAGLSDRIGATFALMADDFIKAFQPLEGVIVEVNGDTVYIDVGAPAGAQVGQEFAVFRKGDVFYHPLTGRALGRYEEILGYAQVRRVFRSTRRRRTSRYRTNRDRAPRTESASPAVASKWRSRRFST